MPVLFAFWDYSEGWSSTVHGGKVIDVYDDGKVAVEGYPGYRFEPIKLVTLAQGLKIMEQIKASHANRNAIIEKAKRDHHECIKTLLGHEMS